MVDYNLSKNQKDISSCMYIAYTFQWNDKTIFNINYRQKKQVEGTGKRLDFFEYTFVLQI